MASSNTNFGPNLTTYLGAINQSGSSVLENESEADTFQAGTQIQYSTMSAASTGPVYLTLQCLKINNTWLASPQDIL